MGLKHTVRKSCPFSSDEDCVYRIRLDEDGNLVDGKLDGISRSLVSHLSLHIENKQLVLVQLF